jgi:hypothetical protein
MIIILEKISDLKNFLDAISEDFFANPKDPSPPPIPTPLNLPANLQNPQFPWALDAESTTVFVLRKVGEKTLQGNCDCRFPWDQSQKQVTIHATRNLKKASMPIVDGQRTKITAVHFASHKLGFCPRYWEITTYSSVYSEGRQPGVSGEILKDAFNILQRLLDLYPLTGLCR